MIFSSINCADQFDSGYKSKSFLIYEELEELSSKKDFAENLLFWNYLNLKKINSLLPGRFREP